VCAEGNGGTPSGPAGASGEAAAKKSEGERRNHEGPAHETMAPQAGHPAPHTHEARRGRSSARCASERRTSGERARARNMDRRLRPSVGERAGARPDALVPPPRPAHEARPDTCPGRRASKRRASSRPARARDLCGDSRSWFSAPSAAPPRVLATAPGPVHEARRTSWARRGGEGWIGVGRAEGAAESRRPKREGSGQRLSASSSETDNIESVLFEQVGKPWERIVVARGGAPKGTSELWPRRPCSPVTLPPRRANTS